MKALINKIYAFSSLDTGWSGYGVAGPSATAIHNAVKFICECHRQSFEPSTIAPSVEEGITVSFFSHKSSAAFEFSNTGEITAVISDGKDFIHAWPVVNEDFASAIENAWRYVRS